MSEIKTLEEQVQDQNLPSVTENGTETNEKTIEEMENTENIPGVQTIGAATGSMDPTTQEPVKNEELANEQVPAENPTEAPAQAESDAPESAASVEDGTTTKKDGKAAKKNTRTLTPEEVGFLVRLTLLHKAEVKRIANDPRYKAVVYNDGKNAVVDLASAVKAGVVIVRQKMNRIHGRDQKATGESLVQDGAQHMLIVMTLAEARMAGIEVERFANDPHKDQPIPDDALVVIDGHGRLDYLYSLELEKWPAIFAHFMSENASGHIDPKTGFVQLNLNDTIWGGGNFLLIRIFEDGESVEAGWKYIAELVNKGYKYTAACEWATLQSGNITKREITSNDKEKYKALFAHHYHAIKVHEAMVKKFGEGADNTLKLKPVAELIIYFWSQIQAKGYNTKDATKKLVEFIDGLEDEFCMVVKAVTKDADQTRDEKRKGLLKKAFEAFITKLPTATTTVVEKEEQE